jgi:hypothetical protein
MRHVLSILTCPSDLLAQCSACYVTILAGGSDSSRVSACGDIPGSLGYNIRNLTE